MECPNCITTQKCGDLHLDKMSEVHYRSMYGYFIINNNRWVFVPFEKEFDTNTLSSISNTLNTLNRE